VVILQLREVSVIFNGFRSPVVAVVGDAKENVLIVERFVTISEVYSIITERHLEVFVLLVEFETALFGESRDVAEAVGDLYACLTRAIASQVTYISTCVTLGYLPSLVRLC
jgi:hypothetical protein